MAKVQIKSEKVTPFGGIFHVRELFSRYMAPIIDKVLGLRCASYGYQYSETYLQHKSDIDLMISSKEFSANTINSVIFQMFPHTGETGIKPGEQI